jgi:hypothetical protein
MMNKKVTSPSLRLHAAYIAIIGSMGDPEIKKIMAGYGYESDKLEEGKKKYDSVVAANADLVFAKGVKRETAARAANAKKAAKAAFQLFSKTLRGFFGNAMLSSIGLTGQMPFVKAGGILDKAAKTPEMQVKLAECGFNAAKLRSEHDTITAYEEANREYEASVEGVLSSEFDRNEKLAGLEKWLASYLMVAEVALRERKDLKAKIGVAERSVETSITKII